jgi:hypothetical protein
MSPIEGKRLFDWPDIMVLVLFSLSSLAIIPNIGCDIETKERERDQTLGIGLVSRFPLSRRAIQTQITLNIIEGKMKIGDCTRGKNRREM